MSQQKQLLVATHNSGKVVEYAEIMADLNLGWLSLADVAITEDVAETGATLEENAILKAKYYAMKSGLLTLADDSGLEVDALQGQPGVHTARYGGPDLSHQQRYQLLLQNMEGVAQPQRTARFRAVIALVSAAGELLGTGIGVCEGIIALEPAGEGGFGYDPIFLLPDRQETMAQLPSALKHQISHRGRAIRAIEPLLRRILTT